jgi:hypothetical protein
VLVACLLLTHRSPAAEKATARLKAALGQLVRLRAEGHAHHIRVRTHLHARVLINAERGDQAMSQHQGAVGVPHVPATPEQAVQGEVHSTAAHGAAASAGSRQLLGGGSGEVQMMPLFGTAKQVTSGKEQSLGGGGTPLPSTSAPATALAATCGGRQGAPGGAMGSNDTFATGMADERGEDGRAREVAALAENARARASREGGGDGLARTSMLGDVSTEVRV